MLITLMILGDCWKGWYTGYGRRGWAVLEGVWSRHRKNFRSLDILDWLFVLYPDRLGSSEGCADNDAIPASSKIQISRHHDDKSFCDRTRSVHPVSHIGKDSELEGLASTGCLKGALKVSREGEK